MRALILVVLICWPTLPLGTRPIQARRSAVEPLGCSLSVTPKDVVGTSRKRGSDCNRRAHDRPARGRGICHLRLLTWRAGARYGDAGRTYRKIGLSYVPLTTFFNPQARATPSRYRTHKRNDFVRQATTCLCCLGLTAWLTIMRYASWRCPASTF
jgi:hypothetical protein